MSFTRLDPRCALVVIDLQKGIVARPTAHPSSEIIGKAARLADAFRANGHPVVLVNVAGHAPGRTDEHSGLGALPSDWTHLVPELGRHLTDHRVTKHQWGAFTGTDLDQYLRRRGVTQVVLAGISTSVGVESTARSAHELGYNVAFVVEAMTDTVAESHRHSVERIFPRLGEIAGFADVIAELAQGSVPVS